MQKTVLVYYCASIDTNICEPAAQKLSHRTFQLYFKNKQYTKIIEARARVATSFIFLEQDKIQMGKCDVGFPYLVSIPVRNVSEFPTEVLVQLSSKSLICKETQVTIPSGSVVQLELSFTPRRATPCYRKQITIVNLRNQNNRKVVEFTAQNTDKDRVLLHSHFYSVAVGSDNVQQSDDLTFAGAISFGHFIAGSSSLRQITLTNIVSSPLQIRVSSSNTDEVLIFTKNTSLASNSSLFMMRDSGLKEKMLSDMEYSSVANESKSLNRISLPGRSSSNMNTTGTPPLHCNDLIDSENKKERSRKFIADRTTHRSLYALDGFALEKRSRSSYTSGESIDDQYFDIINELVISFEKLAKTPSKFEDIESECNFVNLCDKSQSSLQYLLENELLIPLGGSTIEIMPEESHCLYIVFQTTESSAGGRLFCIFTKTTYKNISSS